MVLGATTKSATPAAYHSAFHELRFDAGRTCLDLVATTHPVERLDGVRRLHDWLVGAGLSSKIGRAHV